MLSTISERLDHCVTLAGCSFREGSRLAGMADSHLSLVIDRSADITTGTAAKYARVFGCGLGWLIEGTGPAPTEEQVRAAVEQARASASSRSQSDACGPEAA